tara:strand:- start:5531 stop:6172 length:642 start_codon:yes stop_codon:yes gene_type:complete
MPMEVGRPCTYSGCRRTAQFNSDFCSEHPNEVSHISNQLIRFEIDGKKKTVDSKEIEHLLNRLKKAKKFWIVDLTVDENEFVQYAIEKGELEHWDRLEMIESKEMTTEDAFSTLRTKITGDYSGHEIWWSEDGKPLSDESTGHSEEELDQQGKNHPILFALGAIAAIFLIAMFISNPGLFVGELFIQGICGLIFLGGAGASTLGRSDTGKFTK